MFFISEKSCPLDEIAHHGQWCLHSDLSISKKKHLWAKDRVLDAQVGNLALPYLSKTSYTALKISTL